MPMSRYVTELRARIGSRLLLLPGVAAVIRDRAGRVLLQRRADDGRWGMPAGAVDPGETPAEAVVREVWEETGLRVRAERILGVFGGPGFRHRYANGDEVEYTVTVFACTVTSGALAARDDETLELRYFAPAEMPPVNLAYPRELFHAADLGEPLFQRAASESEPTGPQQRKRL